MARLKSFSTICLLIHKEKRTKKEIVTVIIVSIKELKTNLKVTLFYVQNNIEHITIFTNNDSTL